MIDEEWNESGVPLAYLITIRTYGTWLHGDERGSVDTHDGKNIYGMPGIAPNKFLEEQRRQKQTQEAVLLNRRQREIVEEAIKELCEERGYFLHAVNVRSNHAHAVVTADIKPERVADAFKARATRNLRKNFEFKTDEKVWSRGRSRPYLWTPRDVAQAVDYVLYGQGDIPFEVYCKESEKRARSKRISKNHAHEVSVYRCKLVFL